VEIGAHTDAVGTTAYNLDLSQRRADALKAYLIKKGIAADRLLSKGYGESQIKNRCKDGVNCTDAENAVNRRTEFKVVGHQGFKVGDVIKVADIHYEMNKDILDMKRSSGLQEIIQILKKNEISLEIRSHTDSKGTSEYNLELSERRAKAVYDYLVQSGISKHRLKYKGYGETMLINRCKDGVKCTDVEHAANRRTDFKVVGLK
jgi:outer membrane protein OmpA-like peptidoglycan-associated protein